MLRQINQNTIEMQWDWHGTAGVWPSPPRDQGWDQGTGPGARCEDTKEHVLQSNGSQSSQQFNYNSLIMIEAIHMPLYNKVNMILGYNEGYSRKKRIIPAVLRSQNKSIYAGLLQCEIDLKCNAPLLILFKKYLLSLWCARNF